MGLSYNYDVVHILHTIQLHMSSNRPPVIITTTDSEDCKACICIKRDNALVPIEARGDMGA